MGIRSRSSVVRGRGGICDGGAIERFHRFQFGMSMRIPSVGGTTVRLEAMASARGKRVAIGLELV